MAKYKTTVTKKDGTKVSGYIENNRGYYDDGSAIGAGDSIVDKQGTVWTKPDTATTGAGGTGSGTGAGAGTGSGTGTPSAADLISQAIRDNNPTGTTRKSYYNSSTPEKPERTSYLRSAKELADLYDINYDMDYIRGLYDDATAAKYNLLSKEADIAENKFYTNVAQGNATLLDTLKKATSSAIATGASRGLAGAEQLGLMMEAQEDITNEATTLAQDRALMADEIAAEKAQNIIDALEKSNSMKQALAGVSSNVYSSDTQYDVGLLDYTAQMRNVDALFEQIAAEDDINRRAQWFGALEALLGKETADADRISNEKIAADNNATQKAYYNSLGANGSNGGSGYQDYINQVQQIQQLMDEAYAAGDVGNYITYRMARNALTNNTTETYDDIYSKVMGDKYFKNSTAWKNNQPKNPTTSTTSTTPTTPTTPNISNYTPTFNTTDYSDPNVKAAMDIKAGWLLYGDLGIKKAYKEATPEVQAAYDKLYGKP